MIAFTARAGSIKAAASSAAVTFCLYVVIHKILRKEIDWREAKLWALGAGCSMYFLGV